MTTKESDMPTDLYCDQIMMHPSRNWTSNLVFSLSKSLIENHWQLIKTNRRDNALFKKNCKHLEIMFAHIPTTAADYYISDSVTPCQPLALYPEVFGVYAHKFEFDEHAPTKAFNCFINRGCAMRQSWFYFLHRKNLLNHGHVSFWCEDRFNGTDPAQYNQYLFETYNQSMFAAEHLHLRDHVPYKNFDISLEQAIIDSEKSLVIETFYEPNEYLCFTEKTWRAIQLPRPMLLFGPQYAVAHLRRWGFDMFDDVIDHSYDSEPNKFVRQQMILDQLAESIKYQPQLFAQKAKHNHQLLKSYQLLWPQRYKSVVNTLYDISNNESLP